MKMKFLPALAAAALLAGFSGCADQREMQQPVQEIGNKFEEGLSGRGRLIEADRTDPARY
jgi:hypothetical protein